MNLLESSYYHSPNLVIMTNYKVQIKDIMFDLDNDEDEMDHDEESNLQAMLRDRYIHKTYNILSDNKEEAQDEVMDIVTEDTGWCIYSMTTVTL